ncbi:MAG: WecB/TagA/CpsF family glycosyltransferase, partial [Acidimicrobiales bacterium]
MRAPLATVPDRAVQRPRDRRPVAFVAWGSIAGRSAEIAEAVGGEARCFFPMGAARRPPVLLRYLLSAAATVWFLGRLRPALVVVTNPPVPAAWFTSVVARLLGAAVVLDSHPGGFGAQGDRVSALFQQVHRRLVRQAAGVMVTDEAWCERVRAWGGTPLLVHEAPGRWDEPSPSPSRSTSPSGSASPRDIEPPTGLRLLVVGNFGRDEPAAALVEAGRRLPECELLLTGEPARCPPELRASLPPNVRLVGYLEPERYREAVAACDAVVTLTTEPTSVMRAAYEAVYARRPLVLSDWPVARALFPHAVHAPNDAAGLVSAIERLRSGYGRYAAHCEIARAEQLARWESQLAGLLELVAAALHRRADRGTSLRSPAVTLDALSEQAAVRRIVGRAARGRGGRVANVNVDILRVALDDPLLRQALEECDLVLADGMPIVWAARLQGLPVPERVAASEMIWPTCEEAARQGVGVLLLGGSPGTAAAAAAALDARITGLEIGHLCPPFGFEQSDREMDLVVRTIAERRPGVVFCGFGAPKQEKLMGVLARRFPAVWFVACGGTFSMVSGDLPPAPRWMRASALEWLHRLRLEPRRLFGRYILKDLPFVPRLFAASVAVRLGLPGARLIGVRPPISVV